MRIQGHGRTARRIGAAHDQVGDALHAICLDLVLWDGMLFGVPAIRLQQLRHQVRMGRVIAGRRIRRLLHHLL
ncbi:hypothetical protein D3C81_2043570 [compost metagenome]